MLVFTSLRRYLADARPVLITVGLITVGLITVGLITVILAFASYPGTTSATAAVFGPDQRVRLAADQTPLKGKIGLLLTKSTGAMCTAFCVGPDIIATASHCLFGTAASGKLQLSDLVFQTSRDGIVRPNLHATPIAGAETASQSQHIISGTTRLAITPPIDAARDWAVVRLAAPACRAGGLPLSQRSIEDVRRTAARGGLSEIAAHRDLPDSDLRHAAPCAVATEFPDATADMISRDFTNPGAVLFHSCDTGPGSSGSPMLIEGAAGPEVAGINVGTYVLSRAVIAAGDSAAPDASEPIANTAVATSQFASAAAELAARDLLSEVRDVQRLQRLLRSAGFFNRPASGRFTPGLGDAIARFEQASGLSETRLMRRALLSELAAWRPRTQLMPATARR